MGDRAEDKKGRNNNCKSKRWLRLVCWVQVPNGALLNNSFFERMVIMKALKDGKTVTITHKEITTVVRMNVKYDNNWEEYVVQVFINGILDDDKSYHTDDGDDAISTMHTMLAEAQNHPERYQ